MHPRIDPILEAVIAVTELIEDPEQRQRFLRLVSVSRPGVERAVADLLVDLVDALNEGLDEAQVDLVFRGAEGGIAVEIKHRTAGPTHAEEVPLTGDAEKLTLRLPPDLKDRAAATAAAEGLSLNSWIVRAIARHLSTGGEGPREHGRRARDGGASLRGWVGN